MEFAGGLLLLLAAAGAVWALAGSSRVLYPVRLSLPGLPSDYGLPFEPLSLKASDGVSISGWLLRRPSASGLLLLLHGFGSSKTEWLDLARDLYKTGKFSLLLIDFRGHGQSGPGPVSFGCREVLDVQAALDYAAGDPALRELPVGCWGISMGGAIAIQAASKSASIRAVVADSSYSDTGKAIARAQWVTYYIPRFPLGQFVIWAVEMRLKCRLADLDPVNKIARIAPRPVFLIHGGKDASVPSWHALQLYRAAEEPKTWWLVPEAEHATCYYDRAEEYVKKITEFFQNVFLRTA